MNSSVLVWPDRDQVDRAVRSWIAGVMRTRPEVSRVGYFGSYARGDWGVGSDLDLVAIVDRSDERFERRGIAWPLEALPVPAELLVYTAEEWERLLARRNRFADMLSRETVWIWP